jgi:lysyl-tRNA synthetase class 2
MTEEREQHSAEDALLEARRTKAERVRARGENPFANQIAPSLPRGTTKDLSTLRVLARAALNEAGKYEETKVREAAGSDPFHVRGRVIALRGTGGLTFIRLRDRTGELQLLVSEAEMGAEYARLEDIDIGDIIQAEGALSASKRGELSLETKVLRLVTKAMRPLPEKWHGLTDVETRYRQRYVDLVANPAVAEVFRARSYIVRALRRVLDDADFLEVETPTMHPLIGGAIARPFVTHHNTLDMTLYMRIAPELYLKRLVVGGFERVYEIGRAYRNEGVSTRHNPEFTMCEFYQAYATYEDLMDFTEHLLRSVDADLQRSLPEAHARWLAERPFTFAEPFLRARMDRLVEGAATKSAVPAWQGKNAKELSALLTGADFGGQMKDWSKSSPRAKAIDWGNFRKGFQKCGNDGERLFALYEYLAEPFLAEDHRSQDGKHSLPVFVIDHPAEISPLARRKDSDPSLVDRVELFVQRLQ